MKPLPPLHAAKSLRLSWVLVACLILSALAFLPSASAGPGASGPQEVVSMRTATSDTFINADGSYDTQLYSQPIFYRSDNSWQPIDSSLVQSKATGFALENAHNSFHAHFKGSLSHGFMQFDPSRSKASVSISLESSDKPGMEKRGSGALIYKGARAHSDLRYDMMSSGVKETVILRDSSAPSSYVFDVTPASGEDLSADNRGAGGIYFFNKGDAKPAFVIAPPNVADSNADGTENPAFSNLASMTIEKADDGSFKLTVSIDRKWLDDSGRVFPVYLDPTYVNASDLQDAYYLTAVNGVAQPADTPTMTTYLEAGYDYEFSGSHAATYTFKSVVTFNLSSIPQGAQVTGANAHLYYESCFYTSGAACSNSAAPTTSVIQMRRLTSAWGSGTPWGQITSDGTVVASRTFTTKGSGADATNAWYQLSGNSTLASDVQQWASGSLGFIIEKQNDSSGVSLKFASSRQSSSLGAYLDVTWKWPPSCNPTIGGNPQKGQTLTANPGCSGATPISYIYQWQHYASGTWSSIGTNSSTYTLTNNDVGDLIRVTVTATNSDGSASPTSSTVGSVTSSPINTGLPVISGTATDGSTISTTNGTWIAYPSPTFSYQWQRCDTTGANCSPISGATGQSYTLGNADVGHTIRVTVTATNSLGPTSATSAPTAVVPTPTLTLTLSQPISGSQFTGKNASFQVTAGNVANTNGTVLTATITGANPQQAPQTTLSGGSATLLYAGSNPSTDTVKVCGTVGGVTNTCSPTVPVYWVIGSSSLLETLGVPGASPYATSATAAFTGTTVNSSSGNFFQQAIDISVPGTGIPFALNRTFNSLDQSAGILGRGWSTGFPYLSFDAQQNVTLTGGDGPEIGFIKSGNSYQGDSNVTATLSQAGPGYQIVLQNQDVQSFDSSGKLVSWLDQNGQGLQLAYNTDGHVSSVTDSAGRVFNFTYTSGLLTSVSLPGGTSVSYGYTGGLLTSLTDQLGKTTNYSYDSNGYLASATDGSGKLLFTNTYDTQGRVLTQTDAKENKSTFDWGKDTFTNANGSTWQDSYDANGRLIKTIDPLGNLPGANPADHTTTYTYDSAGQQISKTDPLGQTTKRFYDGQGSPVKQVSPSGATTTHTFDSLGHQLSKTDPLGNATNYVYDLDGRLVNTTDPLGHSTTSTYDAAGRLVASTDALGNTTKTVYDADGRQVQVINSDADGNQISTTESAYDAVGNLISSTDADGKKTTYTYDADGQKLSKTDPLGNAPGANPADYTTTYAYDPDGRLVKTTDPLGHSTTSTYDAVGRLVATTDAKGNTTKTVYDAAGRQVQIINYDADGNQISTTESTYDAAGRLVASTDALGNTTKTVYDADGRQVQVINSDADGNQISTTESAYDAVGNLISSTDADGKKTTYTYDADGQKLSKTDPLGNAPGANPADYTTTYAYDPDGRLVKTTDPLGHSTTSTYDAVGRLVATTDAKGNTTKTVYAKDGKTVTTTDPLGHSTTSTYDAAGRPLKTIDPLGNATTNTYDDAGELVATTDANGHTTSYAYDADGRKTSVTAPGLSVTNFKYDSDGNLLSTTDTNGHTTSYTYDAAGNRASKTNALGETWHYSYDANGNLTETKTPSGGTIDQVYDSENRLIHKSYSGDTPSVSYTYDAAGNKTQMTDGVGTTLYTYDAGGQLIEASTPSGNFLYTYDPSGDLLSRTYPNGLKTTYTYNDSNEMVTASVQSQATYYTYDPDGRLSTTLHPNGTLDQRTYDASGHLASIVGKESDGSSFSSRSYTYDPVGNPTQMTASTSGANLIGWPNGDSSKSWQETYSYDAQNRLTKACMDASCSHYYSYTYDGVGNRLSQTTDQGTTTYSYDAADELTSVTSGSGTTNDNYDQNGNETKEGSTSYSYNLANELTKETKQDGSQVSYAYSGDGLMASRSSSSGTTNYAWDTSSDLPQLAIEGSHSYTYGEGPLGFIVSSGTYTFHTDALGSVVELSNSSGNSAESYRYSPYGEADSADGSSRAASPLGNSLRYASQYLDSETGLYDMRAREYDPGAGRFLEVDPQQAQVGDASVGGYVYADDEPTVEMDPSGMSPSTNCACPAEVVLWNWYKSWGWISAGQRFNDQIQPWYKPSMAYSGFYTAFNALNSAYKSKLITLGNALKRINIVTKALSTIGTRYIWGGGGYSSATTGQPEPASLPPAAIGSYYQHYTGLDCSGLVMFAYYPLVSFPVHTAESEMNYTKGTNVTHLGNALPGDLMFYGSGGYADHVAIYLGDHEIVNSPQTWINGAYHSGANSKDCYPGNRTCSGIPDFVRVEPYDKHGQEPHPSKYSDYPFTIRSYIRD